MQVESTLARNRRLAAFDLRYCSACDTEKSISEFWRHGAGRQNYCKTCSKTARVTNLRHRPNSDIVGALLRSAQTRAKARGLPFELKREDVIVPDACPALGIPLAPVRGRFGGSDSSPSIDRVRNELGYVPGNIIVVSWRANRLKSDASIAELRAVVDFYEKVAA